MKKNVVWYELKLPRNGFSLKKKVRSSARMEEYELSSAKSHNSGTDYKFMSSRRMAYCCCDLSCALSPLKCGKDWRKELEKASQIFLYPPNGVISARLFASHYHHQPKTFIQLFPLSHFSLNRKRNEKRKKNGTLQATVARPGLEPRG